MLDLIVEPQNGRRQHRNTLEKLVKHSEGTVRIASAYVTDTKLLSGIDNNRDVRLLTYFKAMDIIAGATSLDALRALIRSGVQCRYVPNGPRLHAKVYIFGDESAVVTSANLTRKALDQNIEVGIHLPRGATRELIRWFDKLWDDEADIMDLALLSEWKRKTEIERETYAKLRKKVEQQSVLPSDGRVSAEELRDLFSNTNRFFVCNTDRRRSRELERQMHLRGYATAWETFKYPSHMKKVKPGDLIFMYAKGMGIVGIGRAKSGPRILEADNRNRIREGTTREWRVPVDWVAWKTDRDSLSWTSPHATFFDVSQDISDDKYASFRDRVRRHFLK